MNENNETYRLVSKIEGQIFRTFRNLTGDEMIAKRAEIRASLPTGSIVTFSDSVEGSFLPQR